MKKGTWVLVTDPVLVRHVKDRPLGIVMGNDHGFLVVAVPALIDHSVRADRCLLLKDEEVEIFTF